MSVGLLGAFKSKAGSNSINNTNSENKSINGFKYLKLEKIKENTEGHRNERHKNIKRNIEGLKEKQDFECKINADKKFKEFVGNLSVDHNDIKYLKCGFVSNFQFCCCCYF